MTEKRYRVYQKGNYFAINDDIGEVAVISCIRTEIEAEWLCDLLNKLNDENEQLKKENKQLKHWNNCLAEKRHQELKKWSDK